MTRQVSRLGLHRGLRPIAAKERTSTHAESWARMSAKMGSIYGGVLEMPVSLHHFASPLWCGLGPRASCNLSFGLLLLVQPKS